MASKDKTVRVDTRGRIRLPVVEPSEYYVYDVAPNGTITLTPAYAQVIPISRRLKEPHDV